MNRKKRPEALYEEYIRKYYLEVLEPTINEVVLNKKTLEVAIWVSTFFEMISKRQLMVPTVK